MPAVSVVMPVYNVEHYVAESIRSVLAQSFTNFELIIVNDASTDSSLAICESFDDPRIRIVSQKNRGLAGARNTGIRHATGRYVALLDSDDLWTIDKLAQHVAHLDANPDVGVSYSPSSFIDEHGRSLGYSMRPKLTQIDAADVFLRNPVGNGSAPVLRRETLGAIAFLDNLHGESEWCYFDEHFRQSEDIECWLRIALLTPWRFEGIQPALTHYRVNDGGLSANLMRQHESWERCVVKARGYAPDFISEWEPLARAFQLRYLARRSVRQGDAGTALRLLARSIHSDASILLREPLRTLSTVCAALVQTLVPISVYRRVERLAMRTSMHLRGNQPRWELPV